MRHLIPTVILCCAAGMATAQSADTVRIRGTVQAATPDSLTVKDRSGETVVLDLPANATVQEVYPIRLADIQPGSFIGTAALPQADGSQRAIAVTVFPEAARGLAEGHRAFDLLPQSTMTNATVASLASAPDGQRLLLSYRDGQKTVVVPPDAPVVTWRPGDRTLLVPGASVSLTARQIAGRPTAERINAGRNGFALPY